MKILWTDETWITYGRHRKTYITRTQGEELDPTCVIEREQRKRGWMFWGCFSGFGKGPGIFWEKDWGTISGETYRAHTVPVIDGWIRLNAINRQDLILMQDGAPGHAADATQEDLDQRGVTRITWPPYSPDLNPIENCWNWMKDYVADRYGDEPKPTYDKLRKWVNEAWEELPIEFWGEQLASMPDRMQAVKDANGMHTKY
jgi:transposase